MRRWPIGLPLLLLLAGCAAKPGDWAKPGVDAAATAHEYQDCHTLAASAVKTDVGIDQDIIATRGSDWQRTSIARVDARNRREETSDRAAAIVASCMRAKGFAKPK